MLVSDEIAELWRQGGMMHGTFEVTGLPAVACCLCFAWCAPAELFIEPGTTCHVDLCWACGRQEIAWRLNQAGTWPIREEDA